MAESTDFPKVHFLKTNVGEDNKINVGDWLAKNGFISTGWNLVRYDGSERGSSLDGCEGIGSNFEKYEKLFIASKMYGPKDLAKVEKIRALQNNPGAFVWIRDRSGNYYVGLIPDGAQWHFANSDDPESDNMVKGYVPEGFNIDDVKLELRNRIKPVIWSGGIPASKVAGSIRVRFDGPRSTLQNTKDERKNYSIVHYTLRAFLNYSKGLDTAIRDDVSAQLSLFKENRLNDLNECAQFYACLSPDDTEDLLAMYLLAEKGYVVVPSTNKSGTPQVEFDLFDPCDGGKRAYIQVKNNCHDTKMKKILVGNDALRAYEEIAEKSSARACEFYVLQTNDASLEGIAASEGWERVSDREWRKGRTALYQVDPVRLYEKFAKVQYGWRKQGKKSYITPLVEQWMDWLSASE